MGHSWVDGMEATVIPVDDRGLNYADGAFETLLCRDGRITCLSLHEERLSRALSVLRFEAPQAQARRVFEGTEQCLLRVGHTGPARLTVTRGSGPRGYTPSRSAAPRWILTASAPVGPIPPSWRCGIATIEWQDQPQLAGLKLLARTEQVLAAQEAAAQGWDDALMLDNHERVISSSRGNILLIVGKTALTPSLHRSGIAGTRRQLLIESVLPDLGYEVQAREVTMDDVLSADCLIISNALLGAVAVRSIDQHVYSGYERCFNAIRDALRERII